MNIQLQFEFRIYIIYFSGPDLVSISMKVHLDSIPTTVAFLNVAIIEMVIRHTL